MAESVAALEQCLHTSTGKVERIRQAIERANSDHGKFGIHSLRLYLKTVDAAYDEYNGFLTRIYLSDPSKREEFEAKFVDFEELYEFVRISLSEMIQQHEDDQKAIAELAVAEKHGKWLEQSAFQPGTSRNTAPIQIVPSLLLQQTPLPTFDGSYDSWYKFRDRFKDIVDKCSGDSPATKLHYLDKALVGRAQGSIDQQTLNDNNYEGAWRILTKKYENLRMVVQGHVTQLLSLKPMVRGTHAELRSLLDVVEKRLESLAFHNLKMHDKLSEAIVVNLVISKLDLDTRKAWEATVEHGKLPEYKPTMDFLRQHCYMLERCEQSTYGGKLKNAAPITRSSTPVLPSKAHTVTVQQQDSCLICSNDHQIESCDSFQKMNVSNRYTKARQFGLCFACLKKGHRTTNCRLESSKWCPCKKKHHPLLHGEEKKETSEEATVRAETKPVAEGSGSTNETANIVAKCEVPVIPVPDRKQVLLATAVVDVVDVCGVAHKCRALLDSGAMASFVSERMSDLLTLRKEYVNIPVVGVNGAKSTVKFKISATVKSRTSDCAFVQDYLVVPRVTGTLPSMKLDAAGWPIPTDLQLADPGFFDPSRVDMLIGAEVFYDLLQAGKIRMAEDLPLLQESLLGWLVAGPVYNSEKVVGVRVCQATAMERSDERLYDLMKRFWAIDEQRNEPLKDDDCEEFFKATYSRAEDGRYVVKLPFRKDASSLGESRSQAVKQFKALENRLDKHPEQKQMYADFVHKLLDLGHARILDSTEIDADGAYYLPHHCVLKPESSTTKLRVVYNASAKTTTDVSLNDVLMEAPTVQSPLFDIILCWRLPRYVFSADVQRMYEQVLVDGADTKYQRFVWRDDRSQPLIDIELLRVTYGIGPAGFLATRSLVQLAKDEQDTFPDASKVVLKSFYVDDTLSGADTIEKAKQLRDDLQGLLRKGGFKLHKWCANDPEILEGVPPEDQEKLMGFEDSEVNGVIKTLGLLWDPINDDFLFRVDPVVINSGSLTKRQVLSEIAKLFDPLGVLGPIVVLVKMVMQQLWRKKIGWDDPIPEEELQVWKKLRAELCKINNMRIPRRVTVNNPVEFELIGFADSSRLAYGCCIYLKSVAEDGSVAINLLCGKSRVSPLKEIDRKEGEDATPAEMTIPRLELCAAVLLAKQIKSVRETLGIDIKRVVLRSDSEIVLWWLRRVKPEQSVFVRNRVGEIRQLVPDAVWLHVRTGDNPADLISRGVLPMDLMNNSLWWNGPDFLYSNGTEGSDQEKDSVTKNDEEAFEETVAVIEAEVVQDLNLYEVIENCSNFRKLQRVFGYVSRFIHNVRAKCIKNERRSGRLTAVDYRDSLYSMAKIVQHSVYREEIKNIQQNKPVTDKLQNLSPIYDEAEKLLRVGGRIRNSNLPRDQKHPIILPEKNHFTDMVIEAIHREQLHVGLNGLLAKVREQFYPVQAKRTIHRVLRTCIKCFRVKPKDVKQYMGDYPSARVTAAQPIERTGVDYAGPFYLKMGRFKEPMKAYVSVFVCMSTKAIHFELVGSLSTDGFLGALHRFVGRRGIVRSMFSDNGTNFIGAEGQLTELKELLKSQLLEKELEKFCQPREIDWSFNPPKAPHQGGLWEAGVKSMKTHLHKVMNQAYLTYEEMLTLLAQIEAILNSRPLVQQSDDPTDYQALSPGHFLIGRALTAVPEPYYDEIKETALTRYQVVQKRKQAFWKRWSNEYITGLQRRSKWFRNPTPLKEGLLVVLKDENLPPQTWKLGRIVQLHPGADGIVRVVTVRTSGGTYKRPSTQIAVLPIDDEDNGGSSKELSHPAPGGGC